MPYLRVRRLLRNCTANSINSSSWTPGNSSSMRLDWRGTHVLDFSLWYLYYDYLGERSEAHKREIQSFASYVGEEIRFKALTYQEVYHHLQESDQPDPEYLDYLCARYFS